VVLWVASGAGPTPRWRWEPRQSKRRTARSGQYRPYRRSDSGASARRLLQCVANFTKRHDILRRRCGRCWRRCGFHSTDLLDPLEHDGQKDRAVEGHRHETSMSETQHPGLGQCVAGERPLALDGRIGEHDEESGEIQTAPGALPSSGIKSSFSIESMILPKATRMITPGGKVDHVTPGHEMLELSCDAQVFVSLRLMGRRPRLPFSIDSSAQARTSRILVTCLEFGVAHRLSRASAA